ncbi:hypothetical protein L202_07992 [Cryptococcus amylolentus CBS 6039]|uniref:Uncharacterized protein n=1 Tax=Cryptococcus amylolentus CBS 6039 TaxID=1295533 RepID=A0A1E3HBG8_9TREE|nr:hypothetical protein L202_07992 [Cryptococcus amylolentus CBS 6039]ODN73485.1 hypothetical protein L202_07992 [Cryptococcus amylolentus CBS 6039]
MPPVLTPRGGGGQPFSYAAAPSLPNYADLAARQARMETFQKVKPICVSLMSMASEHPTPYSQHHKVLEQLYTTITTVPQSTLDPAVINYILFPLTTVIRQSNPATLPDAFLEASFGLLAHLVGAWRKTEAGMDITGWEQLWKFGVAAVGPRVVKREGEKGKRKEVGQEVQVQAIKLLSALLSPSDLPKYPTADMLDKVSSPQSSMLPTLFQTITLLLETSQPTPPYHALQLSSLVLLRSLLSHYFSNNHQVLAAVLPGTVSAMAKIINEGGKGLKGEVARECARIVEGVVSGTLADEDLVRLGVLRAKAEDLSGLAEQWEEESTVPASPASAPSPSPSARPDPFPPLTPAYLSFTSSQLVTAISPMLSILIPHPSDDARHGAISLASTLIEKCSESLPLLRPRSLTTLLLLSQDTFDPVRHEARRRLRSLLPTESLQLSPVLLDLLNEAINAMPRLVSSHQDTKVDELARLITAIAESSSSLAFSSKGNAIAQLLGPDGNVERWGWSLLSCFEFGKPAGWAEGKGGPERTSRLGWEGGLGGQTGLLLDNGTDQDQTSEEAPLSKYPSLSLRHVESEETTRKLRAMLSALGSTGGEAALHSVEYFMLFAKSNKGRHVAKSVSAMWVAEALVQGIQQAQIEGVEGKISRGVRKMAKEMAKVVVALDEDGEEQEGEDPAYGKEEETGLVPIERTSGVNALTTILDKNPLPNSYTAEETRKLEVQAQKTLLTALSLQGFSVSAGILSSSFRPLLLTTLYIVLSHLASPQPIVQSYASTTLTHIAHYTNYSSPSDLILDNVDYVINVVTQRLTYKRLSPSAPLVLIAMIRLVGAPIVPLVQDVVDEVFDALDEYHGYETMTSGLLAVLVVLVEVMGKEVQAEGVSEERKKKVEELKRIEKAPNVEEDLRQFGKWWDGRQELRAQEVEELLERAPQHAWGKKDIPGMEEEPGADEDTPMPDAEEAPATRTQQVATRILSKSLHFLTHRSPFLRSKVLSLVANAIPVLALGNRESDLLPLIHDSWGTILNRLDDGEAYVVVEAAGVIAALCEHAGDFMSKKVLDHAWPRLLKVMDSRQKLDKKSALAKRGVVGTKSSHTVSHRLHLAILRVATFIAREVPVNEGVLWEMMVKCRVFIDGRVNEELQVKGMGLFEELRERDGDALWVVLKATMGEDESGTWRYLKDGLDIEGNGRKLLEAL